LNIRRLATALLLSGVAVIVTATPAFAHAELIASDPAQNASLATAPQQIQLTFNEAVTVPENPVTITGPDGAAWTAGTPSIAGAVVTVPVQASGPAGPYVLAYQVISDDGDDVRGSVAFTLTTAVAVPTTSTASPPMTSAPPPATTTTASAENTAATTSDSDGGVPVWVWILGGVVLVGAGLVLGLRMARPKNSGS